MENPLNIISSVNEKVSGAISLISSKKEYVLKQTMNVLLLFVILAVFGCLDFATLTFHFEYLSNPNFWLTIVQKMIAGVCAFNIGINLMWDTEIKKDKTLHDAVDLYYLLLDYKQIDFEEYITKIFNPHQKRLAYISYINKEIYILNKHAKASDKLLYSSELPERQAEKLKNRYCKKRQELEDLKSDDYINKNIGNIKVKYFAVDPAVFELEIDGSTSIKGIKTKGSVAAGRVKATSSVVIGMLGFAMLTSSFTLSFNQQQFASQMEAFWHYALHCIEDVGVVVWQVLRGTNQTRKIISEEMTQVYVGRNKVLQEYLQWRLVNRKKNTEVYDELHSQQEIEITQEELDKLKNK